MAAWVLLRHDLPDGTWHWDWLLEPRAQDAPFRRTSDDQNERSLISFRLPAALGVDWRPDVLGTPAFTAEILPPHRRRYLTFEGDIGPGADGVSRGRVKRVAGDPTGLLYLLFDPDRFEIVLWRLKGPAGFSPKTDTPHLERLAAGTTEREKLTKQIHHVIWIGTPKAKSKSFWHFEPGDPHVGSH